MKDRVNPDCRANPDDRAAVRQRESVTVNDRNAADGFAVGEVACYAVNKCLRRRAIRDGQHIGETAIIRRSDRQPRTCTDPGENIRYAECGQPGLDNGVEGVCARLKIGGYADHAAREIANSIDLRLPDILSGQPENRRSHRQANTLPDQCRYRGYPAPAPER